MIGDIEELGEEVLGVVETGDMDEDGLAFDDVKKLLILDCRARILPEERAGVAVTGGTV